jgi:DNA-directed RNA polymerase subunit K/omega
MNHNPTDLGRFEFVTLAALRTTQLLRGCRALVPASTKVSTTAQREVAGGFIRRVPPADVSIPGK